MEFGPFVPDQRGHRQALCSNHVRRPRDPFDFGSSGPEPGVGSFGSSRHSPRAENDRALRTADRLRRSVAAVVTDVAFRHPADIEPLRHLLSQPPRSRQRRSSPFLRDNSHLERVFKSVADSAQPYLFPAECIGADISGRACAELFDRLHPFGHAPANSAATAQNLRAGPPPVRDHLRCSRCARRRRPALDEVVDTRGSDSAMAAIAEGGVRQWLDVVGRIDEATLPALPAGHRSLASRSSPPACGSRAATRKHV